MANLRENNQRLQEESQTASEQLRKFSMFFTNLNKTGSDHEAHSLTHENDSKREWSTAAEEEEKEEENEIQARGRVSVREIFFQEAEVTDVTSLSFQWTALNQREWEKDDF